MLRQPRALVPFAFQDRRVFRSSLSNGLISYWKLDESSAGTSPVTRNDSSGSNHLTDSNNCPSATGKIGNAAQFASASSQELSVASNASLQTGDIDFTFACWFYLNTLPSALTVIAGKADSLSSGHNHEWALMIHSSNALRFRVCDSGGAVSDVTSVTLSTGNWYYVVAWHDSVGDLLRIQVNGGTVTDRSYSGDVQTLSAPFRIGGGASGQYFDGLVDEAGFWKRVLTDSERSLLYSSGVGKSYPFL